MFENIKWAEKPKPSRAEITLCSCDKSPYQHTHDKEAKNKKPAILVIE